MTFVYKNKNKFKESRYALFLTGGTDLNTLYMIDPIISNGGTSDAVQD